MSSQIVCDKGHLGGLCREAAVELSKEGQLSPCQHPGCNAPRRYITSHHYANSDEVHEYEVAKVLRLRPDEQVKNEGYDPMVFLLRHRESGDLVIWLFYWGRDRKQQWRVGQFPPLLRVDELTEVLTQIRGWHTK